MNTATMVKPKLTKMRLLYGKYQILKKGKDGKRIIKKPGDIVELTDTQMKAFKGQFEDPAVRDNVVGKAKVAKVEAEQAAEEAAEAKANADALAEAAEAEAEAKAEAAAKSSAKK